MATKKSCIHPNVLVGHVRPYLANFLKGVLMNKIVRALELGFGTTSLVCGVNGVIPEIMTYPSLVAQVDKAKDGLNAGLNKRNTVQVEVEGVVYEVGPEANLAAGRKTARVLNSSYVHSQQYKALLFGSLVLMNEPVIDLLVLGLPVDHWSRRDELKELVVGTHLIGEKEYTVKNAWVIVQPMGGLFSYANSVGQEGYNELRDMTILSVDPGYGTFDFCVSHGLKVNESLSDGYELGMSSVLDAVSKNLKSAFGDLGDIAIERIDEAFYKNDGFIRLAGRKYPFPICRGLDMDGEPVQIKFNVQQAIDETTHAAITKLKNKVGNGADFDLILLMGGPAKVYLPALQAGYPNHKVIHLDNSIKAICQGMYFGGLQYQALLDRKSSQ